MGEPIFPPLGGIEGSRQVAPTDIARYVRLDQCDRYLRFRLHERALGTGFMDDFGVRAQRIPPLFESVGAEFEQSIEAAVEGCDRIVSFRDRADDAGREWQDDNDAVVDLAQTLNRCGRVTLFQPRLQVEIDGWCIRGAVDILRFERIADGKLQAFIADMKRTKATKVEHRLQVAFYHEMLARLLTRRGIPFESITMGILYQGPSGIDAGLTDDERQRHEEQRDAAEAMFGARDAPLELIENPGDYLGAVADLVTGAHSAANRVARLPFEDVAFDLAHKCDGCLYNAFCLKWSIEHDDLSLLPYLTLQDKGALQRLGITTTRDLATLKEPDDDDRTTLVPAPGREALVEAASAAWPVGPRLDELIHRARRYRAGMHREPVSSLTYIPNKGYGSLPYSDANQNPNLVRIYIDAQHDYLHDRIYMLGALLAGNEQGLERPERRRRVVRVCEGPPESPAAEERLLVAWIDDVIQALGEIAAPDAAGERNAPIHLIFYDSYEQRLLLDALARHFSAILHATALYDFMTQLAAFDSPMVTFLDQEIRDHRNYPIICPSLQAVSSYLRFDWQSPEPYNSLFRLRVFDFPGPLNREAGNFWRMNHARYSSQIPLEYVYGAWDRLELTKAGAAADYRQYLGVTLEQVTGFQGRRLEAMEHIARDFKGNRFTTKTPFHIPSITHIDDKARDLAQALDEFVTIERHVSLAEWKAIRNIAPERRVLAGETLLVTYHEHDQQPETVERNREIHAKRRLREQYLAELRARHPDDASAKLLKEQNAETRYSIEGMEVWLRISAEDVECTLNEVVGLTLLRPGESIIINPRIDVDTRPDIDGPREYTPTPKSMLYATRGRLQQVIVDRDADGIARSARVLVRLDDGARRGRAGYIFTTIPDKRQPFDDGRLYMIDPDPNDWMGSHSAGVTDGLTGGARNTLYQRLSDASPADVTWPDQAARGQAQFLAGLDALEQAGALHGFEQSKREYIGQRGDAPILLVQGPPGTGKSYSTAFAIFARVQGAMLAEMPMRVVVSCKTHAAVDVLLDNVLAVREKLAGFRATHPEIFGTYFAPGVFDIPLLRIRPNQPVPDAIITLPRDNERAKGTPRAIDRILEPQWCVVGATPGGVRGAVVDKFATKNMFDHQFCDLLVLDEASQMNLPEAIMAALPFKRDGQMVVVGDHRQMPPIVAHDWANERRRTFHEYRSYESLFETLLQRDLPTIRFSESFRLHADMAEFLRREIYRHDGICFHSRKRDVLEGVDCIDPFVAAVLAPDHPIVTIVHDEDRSQLRNQFEQDLITPVLEALAQQCGLDVVEGLGVVVPHRAQRAALQEDIDCLVKRDPDTGAITLSAVDTVERFQGGERTAIVYSATESDPHYLLSASKFLMDPRRLTVALSRAKRKMIVMASRSVFSVFSSDEETFANAQLWKNLLRHTCTVPLWRGEVDGHQVEVWGNAGTG